MYNVVALAESSAVSLADIGITADTIQPVILILVSLVGLVLVAGMGFYGAKAAAKMLPKMLGWFIK